MANQTRSTRDREEIRRWAEERGGRPSHVRPTGSGEDIGILRIDFPGYTGEETLELISWEDWFDKFEDQDLVLIYQDETAGGEHKIVNAATEEATKKKSAPAKKKKAAATKKKAAKSAAKRDVKKAAAKKSSARVAKKTTKKKSTAKRSGKKTATKKVSAKKRVAKKRR